MSEVSSRRSNTRRALIEAATRVIATKGIDASVEELCEAAGFSRGAFYSNFSSRAELFVAIVDHYQQAELQAFESCIPPEPREFDRDQIVAGAIDHFLELWWGADVDVLLTMHLIRLPARRDPELREAMMAVDENMNERLLRTLSDGLTRHGIEFRVPLQDALTALRCVYLGSMVDALLVEGDVDILRHRLAIILKALLKD